MGENQPGHKCGNIYKKNKMAYIHFPYGVCIMWMYMQPKKRNVPDNEYTRKNEEYYIGEE